MFKVYIVGGDYFIQRMFKSFPDWEITDDFEDADLIQFTGGEDVTPALYQEEPEPETRNSVARDIREVAFFFRALADNKYMAGICRGGQFLNVCNGGKMRQHIGYDHCKPHHLMFDNGWENTEWVMTDYKVTSTHHQQMIPHESANLVINAEDDGTEIVLYKKTKCLCFQPHPEYEGYKECTELYHDFLQEYMFQKLRGTE